MGRESAPRGFSAATFTALAAFLALVLLSAVWMAIAFAMFDETAFDMRGWLVAAVAYGAALAVFCRIFDCFSYGFARVRELAAWTIMALLCVDVLVLIAVLLVHRVLTFGFFAVSLAAQSLVAVCLCYLLHTLYVFSRPVLRVVALVGGYGYERRALCRMMEYAERYSVERVVLVREDECMGAGRGIEELIADSERGKVPEFDMIAIGSVANTVKRAAVAYCYEHRLATMSISSTTDILMQSFVPMQLNDIMVFCRPGTACSPFQGAVKRGIDIFGALVGLVIFAIPMGICAIAIKAYDGGPVLYRQERLTRAGKVFRICKLRSMRVDAEASGARLAVVGDDRITPVGRIMRRCRLDEAPQFYNVLVGDMSLIGPRAERPEIADVYTEQHPMFSYRLKMKAGISGYAQVNGCYATCFEDKLKMDLYYIEHFSLRMDCALLIQTVKVLFAAEAAEGFDKAQAGNPLDAVDWKSFADADDRSAAFIR